MNRVLIVDDDNAILDALKITLEEVGFKAKTLSSGLEILKIAQEFNPGVILLDIWMSGKDGLQLTADLKANPATRRIPIILISALSDVKKLSRKSGADDFLTKPFSIEDVVKKIRKYMPDLKAPLYE